ncbi:YugN family protein [Pontibacillus salicampi]|uniref:YugN family protein n=1 Tax=Pontibacillus salicampi TaxID=1449801 RepID=A0ABV6LNP3_9BACI
MKLEGIGIEGATIELNRLDHLMEKAGFIRGGQWDYERVTYDYKLETNTKGQTYYVRIQGASIEGEVDRGDAVIKLMIPLLGLHYYPHGIEYGDSEEFTEAVIDRAKGLLERVKGYLLEFEVGSRPSQAVLEELRDWAEKNDQKEVLEKIQALQTFAPDEEEKNKH